tara:strand:+ start:595 stop:744 length:150 start_codon:yes stop_codon:yes gene_type:complete
VDFLDDGADYSETNLSSNSSRLGFKGNHEINPNLKAGRLQKLSATRLLD